MGGQKLSHWIKNLPPKPLPPPLLSSWFQVFTILRLHVLGTKQTNIVGNTKTHVCTKRRRHRKDKTTQLLQICLVSLNDIRYGSDEQEIPSKLCFWSPLLVTFTDNFKYAHIFERIFVNTIDGPKIENEVGPMEPHYTTKILGAQVSHSIDNLSLSLQPSFGGNQLDKYTRQQKTYLCIHRKERRHRRNKTYYRLWTCLASLDDTNTKWLKKW